MGSASLRALTINWLQRCCWHCSVHAAVCRITIWVGVVLGAVGYGEGAGPLGAAHARVPSCYVPSCYVYGEGGADRHMYRRTHPVNFNYVAYSTSSPQLHSVRVQPVGEGPAYQLLHRHRLPVVMQLCNVRSHCLSYVASKCSRLLQSLAEQWQQQQ